MDIMKNGEKQKNAFQLKEQQAEDYRVKLMDNAVSNYEKSEDTGEKDAATLARVRDEVRKVMEKEAPPLPTTVPVYSRNDVLDMVEPGDYFAPKQLDNLSHEDIYEYMQVPAVETEKAKIHDMMQIPAIRNTGMKLSEYRNLEIRHGRLAAHLLLNEKSKSDSGLMTRVKNAVEEAEDYLQMQQGEYYSEENMKLVEDKLEAAIRVCDEYCSKRNSSRTVGKKRKQMVVEVMNEMIRSRNRLRAMREAMMEGLKPDEYGSYPLDLLNAAIQKVPLNTEAEWEIQADLEIFQAMKRGNEKADSPEMRTLKEVYEGFVRALQTTKLGEESAEDVIRQIEEQYGFVIAQCTTYINEKPKDPRGEDGKTRLAFVKELQAKMILQRSQFADAIHYMEKKGMTGPASTAWLLLSELHGPISYLRPETKELKALLQGKDEQPAGVPMEEEKKEAAMGMKAGEKEEEKPAQGIPEGVHLDEGIPAGYRLDEGILIPLKKENETKEETEKREELEMKANDIRFKRYQAELQKDNERLRKMPEAERVKESYEKALKENGPVMQERKKEVVIPDDKEDSITVMDEGYNTKYVEMKQPLFPSGGKPDISDIQQSHVNDCYLLGVLGGLVVTNPEYITNHLIRVDPDDEDFCLVRLFDPAGELRQIRVQKTVRSGDHRAPWVQIVEKAASIFMKKQGWKESVLRQEAQNWEAFSDKAQGAYKLFDFADMDKADESLGMLLIFGRKGTRLVTRDEEDYETTFTEDNVITIARSKDQIEGDRTIGKALAAVKQGRMVMASTCTNDSKSEYYNASEDKVKFTVSDLSDEHVYQVLGEGDMIDGEPTIKLRNPLYGGKILNLKYFDFKTCFTSVWIMDSKEV